MLLFCIVTSANATMDDILNNYVTELRSNKRFALYAECKTPKGKALLIYAEQNHDGLYAELEDGAVIDLGVVIYDGTAVTVRDSHGGLWSIERAGSIARYLAKSTFRSIGREAERDPRNSKPSSACPSKT
jgi:hypothetical protein